MGVYLNGTSAYGLFRRESSTTYFVDKTDILKELVPVVETGDYETENVGLWQGNGQKYICITRPRRFGKTVMANMIASYFGKGVDSRPIFQHLKVSGYDWFEKHLNQHNVIHIMFNEMSKKARTYEQYIERIEDILLELRERLER